MVMLYRPFGCIQSNITLYHVYSENICILGKQYNPPQALLNPPGVLLEILRGVLLEILQ